MVGTGTCTYCLELPGQASWLLSHVWYRCCLAGASPSKSQPGRAEHGSKNAMLLLSPGVTGVSSRDAPEAMWYWESVERLSTSLSRVVVEAEGSWSLEGAFSSHLLSLFAGLSISGRQN